LDQFAQFAGCTLLNTLYLMRFLHFLHVARQQACIAPARFDFERFEFAKIAPDD
jgi:hypothetical protein